MARLNSLPQSTDDETLRLALGLSCAVARIVRAPSPRSLARQLNKLAIAVSELPGIRGVIVIALDDDRTPLTSGAFRLALSPNRSQIQTLIDLCRDVGDGFASSKWFPARPDFLAAQDEVLALPVGPPQPSGLILVAPEKVLPRDSLEALERCSEILAAAIQSVIRTEAWKRIEHLESLVRNKLRKAGWEQRLPKMTKSLSRLFNADGATIFVEEHGELHLVASTDPSLREKNVIYRPGEGLTGSIFRSGRSVRLTNTRDSEEVRKVVQIERVGPLFPECDKDGKVISGGQFLGVPMRFGGQVVGVVRVSRRGGSARFSEDDEKALEFFADLLGAALAPAWKLFVYRSILESVSDAAAVSRFEVKADGTRLPRIVLVNAGTRKLLGTSDDEIQGRDARRLYAPGEYDKLRLELLQRIEEAKVRGWAEHGPVRSRFLRDDGTIVPVMITYRILANRLVSPLTLYTIGMARDISKSEQQAEQHERLSALLDNLSVVHFQADRYGRTLDPTETESRITGYSLEELRNMPREKLWVDPGKRAAFLDRARKQGGTFSRELQQMKRKEGPPFWAEGDIRILYDAKGEEVGYEGFYRDVTDRIKMQGFLNADTKRVLLDEELLPRLKAEADYHINYLISLAHQLQTPLAAIVENLRNFEKGITGQRQLADKLPYVIGQAIVCTRQVRNLSYMDKILRGEEFSRESVSLARLAIEIKLDFLHLLKEKNLELSIDDASLNSLMKVQGHREMLRQVIINLVENAIKYSSRNSVIRIRATLNGEEAPAFEISNQGFGIAQADRERIFERGARTKRAQAIDPHGTGLGLWLVRKVVEAHNGSIGCHEISEEGQSRVLFRITFPKLDPSRRSA